MDAQLIIHALDVITDGYIIINADRVVEYANPAAVRLLGDDFKPELQQVCRLPLNEQTSILTISHQGSAPRLIEMRVLHPDATHRVIWLQDVTERTRLSAAEREQRAIADALGEIGARMSELVDLDKVMNAIFDQMIRVVPYDASSVSLLDGDEVYIASERGFSSKGIHLIGLRFPFAPHTTWAQAARQGTPLIIPDTHMEPNWVPTSGTEWLHGHITVPVRIQGNIFGFLHLESVQPNYFTPDHAHKLQLFADQIAIALRNAKLLDDYSRYAEKLERLVEERTASLRAALANEQALNALRSRFISVISHEFKTPLAAILLSADMIKTYSGRLSQERLEEYLASIQSQVADLTLLIDDLVFSYRADQVGFPFQPAHVDILRLCEQIMGEIKPLLGERHHVELMGSLNCPPPLVDERLLHRALINLLTNAIKYSPSGGHIRIHVNCTEDELTLTVSDNGIGIPKAELPHVFDTFFRASNTNGYPGTGIGLTIVKQVTELHGGKVEVFSEVGVGTAFTLRLPQSAAIAPPTR